MGSNTALVVTSCDRHDLLQETLHTFIRTNCGGQKPDKCIIIEDSTLPMPDWMRANIHYYSSNLGTVEWIQNDSRMGQVWSIDRAYAQVKTEFIFHCEDDWRFDRGGFMLESKDILAKYPEIWSVSLRGNRCNGHPLVDDARFAGFKVQEPYWKKGWGGCSWNPGLRRLSDYQRIGSYGAQMGYGKQGLESEIGLSRAHLDLGYRIAALAPYDRPHVEHIGGSRSRSAGFTPTMPRILIAIPVCHNLSYGKWESGDSPSFDRANAYNGEAYGTGIHISGENLRVAALRDTWLRDVAPFKEHIDYRLFYGAPHHRQPEPDEVFLGCGDTYADLPAKTIEICRWAAARDYGYVFKCDDDTGVYVDRVIQEPLTGRFDYGGYLNGKIATGGTGYWLSRRAFTTIAEKASANNHWAEDVTVSKCLFAHNIQGVHLSGHRTGREDHWFWKNGFDPEEPLMGSITSFHAVRPDDMRKWYAAKSK